MSKRVFAKGIVLVLAMALMLCFCGCKSEEAKNVDEEILSIGTVTMDSGYILDKIEADISVLDESDREQLDNLQMFYDAQDTYNSLMANSVIKLIDNIGEVTRKKGSRIEKAQSAYDELTSEQQERVTNYDTLVEAKKIYDKKQKAYIAKKGKPALQSLRKQYDKVQDVTFYTQLPTYIDIRSYVLPYLAKNSAYTDLWIRYNYASDSWVFWTELTILVDGNRYYKTQEYNDVTRDNEGGKVWECFEETASTEDIEMLQAIANSKETIVRFEGDDYYSDLTISKADKRTIQTVLDAFEYLKSK